MAKRMQSEGSTAHFEQPDDHKITTKYYSCNLHTRVQLQCKKIIGIDTHIRVFCRAWVCYSGDYSERLPVNVLSRPIKYLCLPTFSLEVVLKKFGLMG